MLRAEIRADVVRGVPVMLTPFKKKKKDNIKNKTLSSYYYNSNAKPWLNLISISASYFQYYTCMKYLVAITPLALPLYCVVEGV